MNKRTYKNSKDDSYLDLSTKELKSTKPSIPSKMLEGTFYDVGRLKPSENIISNTIETAYLEDVKNNLNKKIISKIKLFENLKISYNRIFILGSLDYLRIVLREEKLNNPMKNNLFNQISEYIQDIEKICSICNGNNNIFENMNLSILEESFNRIQDHISQDFNILPRLDDDEFDEAEVIN